MFTQKNIRTATKYALGLFAIWIAALMIAKLYDAQSQFTCVNPGTAIVVGEGDSAWAIAEKYCTGDVRSATDAIVKVYGSTFNRGQMITLP
jgi:hypothetical protein